jgi:hypothetical protein
MPTPFTHLAYAQRLLADDGLPEYVRHLLQSERPAFLLGSIAADAQTIHGLKRETTHFYSYDQPLETPPYQIMLTQHSELSISESHSQRAFVAGYVFHLSIDEIWSVQMIHPYFVLPQWGNKLDRFLALQLMLITMDERDRAALSATTIHELAAANPTQWLPFLDDDALVAWRDLIARQLMQDGDVQTLNIISERAPASLALTPAALRDMLDSPEVMNRHLWSHVLQTTLAEIEADMYVRSRERLQNLVSLQ